MTPAVVATGIVCASLTVLGVAALVALLAVRGIDPDPVVQLAGTAITAVGSTAAVVLQLVNRRTATRTDRNTGLLASAVAGQLDEHGRPSGPPILKVAPVRPAAVVDDEPTSWLPPVPPAAARPRHAYPAEWENSSGPGTSGGERPGR